MSEWKSQAGLSVRSKQAIPDQDEQLAKSMAMDREMLILDDTRKELLSIMVKNKDQQDINFQTAEELQLKYENQMLKTKVSQLDKRINEMRVEEQRDTEKY